MTLIRSDERLPIARLLGVLEDGEQVARDCALAQAEMTSHGGHRRFFLGQARQEHLHGLLFRGFRSWLAPRHIGASPAHDPLERYRFLLDTAIRRGDLVETILAEQVVLEGLGETLLHRIEAGLIKRRASFVRLRRILLHQEEAHHAFGRRVLAAAFQNGDTSIEDLQVRAGPYLTLAEAMVLELADVFASIDEDASAWAADLHNHLPMWLTAGVSANGPSPAP